MEGLTSKNGKIRKQNDLAKHGLKGEAKISHFVSHLRREKHRGEQKERRRKEEEKREEEEEKKRRRRRRK